MTSKARRQPVSRQVKAYARTVGTLFHLPSDEAFNNIIDGISQAHEQGGNPVWRAIVGPESK